MFRKIASTRQLLMLHILSWKFLIRFLSTCSPKFRDEFSQSINYNAPVGVCAFVSISILFIKTRVVLSDNLFWVSWLVLTCTTLTWYRCFTMQYVTKQWKNIFCCSQRYSCHCVRIWLYGRYELYWSIKKNMFNWSWVAVS